MPTLLALLLATPATAADLELRRLEPHGRPVQGADLDVTVEVFNDGAAVNGAIEVTLRASGDAAFESRDVLLCKRTVATDMPRDATVVEVVTCPWPEGVTGPWLVGRVSAPLLTELDLFDNDAAAGPLDVVPSTAPDLAPDLEGYDGPLRAGEDPRPRVVVRNDGQADAATSRVEVRLSQDAVLDAADPLLCATTTGVVPAGGPARPTLPGCPIPADTPAGAWHLLVVADALDEVHEVDEGDNVLADPVHLGAALPDLVLVGLQVPARAVPGGTVDVDYTLRNDGFVPVASALLSARLSADPTWDPGAPELCAATVPGPAPGATAQGTLKGCLVPDTPGAWHVVARVDADEAVVERDETDNDASAPLAVVAPLPDLAVVKLTPPATLHPGEAFSVPFTLGNLGDGEAALVDVALRLSPDPSFDEAAPLLCEATVLGPAPGTTRDDILDACVIPVDAPTGALHVVARADPAHLHEELDEANNDRAAAVEVLAPADTGAPEIDGPVPDDSDPRDPGDPVLPAPDLPPRWFCGVAGGTGGWLLVGLVAAASRRRQPR